MVRHRTSGRLYSDLLRESKGADRDVFGTREGHAFAYKLAFTLLDVAYRLHRFEGGREFVRLFAGADPILSEELLESILADCPGGKDFLLTDVNFTRIQLNPDVATVLS